MGPHSRPGEFISWSARLRGCPDRKTGPALVACPRVHFPRGERHDRFAGRQKPRGKVAPSSGGSVIARGGVGRLVDRGIHPPWRGSRARRCRSTCKDCSQCLLTAVASGTRFPPVVLGSVANRSVSHPTRLETRTKESNMCASHGVLRNLKAQ